VPRSPTTLPPDEIEAPCYFLLRNSSSSVTLKNFFSVRVDCSQSFSPPRVVFLSDLHLSRKRLGGFLVTFLSCDVVFSRVPPHLFPINDPPFFFLLIRLFAGSHFSFETFVFGLRLLFLAGQTRPFLRFLLSVPSPPISFPLRVGLQRFSLFVCADFRSSFSPH